MSIMRTISTGIRNNLRPSFSRKLWLKLKNRSRLYLVLLLLMLPTLAGMLVFDYYPKWGAVKYSFYRWDGSTTEEFRGFKNFIDAFSGVDPLFWQSFKLVGILLIANLVKMWPSIFTAITIHRLKSEKWQYIYRVLFVIPMVIPGLVWLLIWKNFFDPTVGIFNTILKSTGMMDLLRWLDSAMPRLAATVSPIRITAIDSVFGSVWGLALVGVILLSSMGGLRGIRKGWMWWLILLILSYLVLGPVRAIPALLVCISFGEKFSRSLTGRDKIKWIGTIIILVSSAFVLTSMAWTAPTKAFDSGTPAWLGNTKLIVPSLIFWGFPWVGVVGVLIYLAGLQNISTDVYEAAELDGVGPVGKLFKIELPLIMTQVRINLIFMTIGTLTDYGLILLLLGPHGGPGNKGMVPGLYMFREAFLDGRFGYACALGMILFVMILGITILYTKYVKVEK